MLEGMTRKLQGVTSLGLVLGLQGARSLTLRLPQSHRRLCTPAPFCHTPLSQSQFQPSAARVARFWSRTKKKTRP